MLGVDHDKIILMSTPFPIIPMGTRCFYNAMLEINDIVLYLIVGHVLTAVALWTMCCIVGHVLHCGPCVALWAVC